MLGEGIVSFGTFVVHRLLQELERVAEDRLRDAELPVDVQRRGRELDVALLVVELDGDVAGFLRDAVELVDEVHVPRLAAELAVGRGLQADLLLLAHDLADRVVFDRAQRRRVDATVREVVARLQELRRAEQAADVVGAERRLRPRARCNGGLRLLPNPSSLFPSREDTRGRWSSPATPEKPDAGHRHDPGSRGSPERPADGRTDRQRETAGEDECEIHLEPHANEAEEQPRSADAATHVLRSRVNAGRQVFPHGRQILHRGAEILVRACS